MRKIPFSAALMCLCLSNPTLLGGAPPACPSWALDALAESRNERDPHAYAWVLLDRTEYTYRGDGKIRIHRYKLTKVLTKQGESEGIFSLSSLGGRSSKVRKLKGWNFRPSGLPTTVERSDAILVDPDSGDEVTADLRTVVSLDGVEAGSLVAFESEEDIVPVLGPAAIDVVCGPFPVLRWELAADRSWLSSSEAQPELMARNLSLWSKEIVATPRSLIIRHVPPSWKRGEDLLPEDRDRLPLVFLRFLDPHYPMASSEDWKGFGLQYAQLFSPSVAPVVLPGVDGTNLKDQLRALKGWMDEHLVYRQIYLSEKRGWVPVPPQHVLRSLSGDCKDMAAFFLSAAERFHVEGCPALTRIGTGKIQADEPRHPHVFNHVIAAVAVPHALRLPAQVAVGGSEYLLVDLTDPFTPIGYLNSSFEGNRVLICSKDPSKGGQWVEVPPSAIFRNRVDISLTGEATPSGALEGVMEIDEIGDTLGLAGVFREKGSRELQLTLSRWVSTDADSRLTLEQASEDKSDPSCFRIRARVAFPGTFISAGLDNRLPLVLFPRGLRTIEPPCEERVQPVHWSSMGPLKWSARISVPPGWRLKEGSHQYQSQLREVNWTAREEGKDQWTVQAVMVEKHVTWSTPTEGLVAVNTDRVEYPAFMRSCAELDYKSYH